ncbi:hypothetical protein MMC29_005602 [Sticta canariensis]|nr:hypothetical protein [Sticta canariensis]
MKILRLAAKTTRTQGKDGKDDKDSEDDEDKEVGEDDEDDKDDKDDEDNENKDDIDGLRSISNGDNTGRIGDEKGGNCQLISLLDKYRYLSINWIPNTSRKEASMTWSVGGEFSNPLDSVRTLP